MSTTDEKDNELDDLDSDRNPEDEEEETPDEEEETPDEEEETPDEEEETPDEEEEAPIVKEKKGAKRGPKKGAKRGPKKTAENDPAVAEKTSSPSLDVFGDVEILKRKRVFVEGQKGKAMRRRLAESPLVQIALPVDSMNPKIRFQEFQMNSLYFRLPLGRQIMVPEVVQKFIAQTMYRPRAMHEMFLSA